MATKKKIKKKPVKTKKVAKKRTISAKKAVKKAAKKAPIKKAAVIKTSAKKTPAKKTAPPKKRAPRRKSDNIETVVYRPQGLTSDAAGQSGDLQGLSNTESADSESVDELLEEGNALEAEIVKGVEDAPDADVSEVRTYEVPEDDVPEEYLDQDQQS